MVSTKAVRVRFGIEELGRNGDINIHTNITMFTKKVKGFTLPMAVNLKIPLTDLMSQDMAITSWQ